MRHRLALALALALALGALPLVAAKRPFRADGATLAVDDAGSGSRAYATSSAWLPT